MEVGGHCSGSETYLPRQGGVPWRVTRWGPVESKTYLGAVTLVRRARILPAVVMLSGGCGDHAHERARAHEHTRSDRALGERAALLDVHTACLCMLSLLEESMQARQHVRALRGVRAARLLSHHARGRPRRAAVGGVSA
jgi:hypothetical protein